MDSVDDVSYVKLKVGHLVWQAAQPRCKQDMQKPFVRSKPRILHFQLFWLTIVTPLTCR